MAYIMPGEEQMKPEELNFKEKYRSLKRKMRFLIYEQECFQEELRRAQRKLLKISRDKNFLLDRLLQYERVIDPGTDSDSTLSSEDSCKDTKKPQPKEQEKKVVKKKRRPKKKPTQRLQGMPLLGANRDPLAHDLHSPPPALHQQLPHLAELMRKAAEGLPITQAPTMQVPGSTSGGQDPHSHGQQPPLPSPHSHHPLLSPHHLHPSLMSPTGGASTLGLPPGLSSLPPGPHSIDPRVFDRGLHQAWSGLGMGMGGGMGGGMGHMMGDAGLPHLDLNALTQAAALDKVAQQEKSKTKKSKKESSDKHGSSSHSHSSSHPQQHQITPPLHSSSSTHDNNEDLVIDVPGKQ